MDNLEKERERWLRMSRQGREQETRKIKMLCICPKCGSYNSCAEDREDISFCLLGKSECKFNQIECICPSCPIAKEYGLPNNYYCVKGNAWRAEGKP